MPFATAALRAAILLLSAPAKAQHVSLRQSLETLTHHQATDVQRQPDILPTLIQLLKPKENLIESAEHLSVIQLALKLLETKYDRRVLADGPYIVEVLRDLVEAGGGLKVCRDGVSSTALTETDEGVDMALRAARILYGIGLVGSADFVPNLGSVY